MAKVQATNDVTSELLVVPDEVWASPRALAAYYFISRRILEPGDKNREHLIDNFHGKMFGAFSRVQKYFQSSASVVLDVLKPLRTYGILEREKVDGIDTNWWIFRFAKNVPTLSTTLEDLWKVRRYSRRATLAVETPLPHEQIVVHQIESSLVIPTDLAEQLRLLETVQEAVRKSAGAIVQELFVECAQFARTQHDKVSATLHRLEKVMDPDDMMLAEGLLKCLASLKEYGGRNKKHESMLCAKSSVNRELTEFSVGTETDGVGTSTEKHPTLPWLQLLEEALLHSEGISTDPVVVGRRVGLEPATVQPMLEGALKALRFYWNGLEKPDGEVIRFLETLRQTFKDKEFPF